MSEDVGDSFVSVGEGNQGSRKRTINPRKRKLEQEKRYRQPKGHNSFTPCAHSGRFNCKMFTPVDCSFIRNQLLSVPNKTAQDNFIAKFVSLNPITRRRPRSNSNKNCAHEFHAKYTIIKKSKEVVHVCKKFFMSVMLVKYTRLRHICLAIAKSEHVTETRGGDHRSQKSAVKKQLVREFIKKLRGKESHYSRKKSKRIYLDGELNINKLWKMYNNSQTDDANKVSKSMFRRVFMTFNIGFKSPASDICSYCLRYKNLIKSTADPQKKVFYMTQKRVHSLRAAQFYKLMKKEEANSMTLCFDLQQIQPLPKSPIQEAYYSRQVGFYALCIVAIDGSNPTFYTWTEDQAGKGSTEVASALLEHLKSLEIPEGTKTLTLFCDGCGSQNKNNYVLHTLMHFMLKSESGLETIKLIFPVRGHSFLPADRVFGRVEKILRKKPTIIQKNEYIDIYKSVGSVKVLGESWKLVDAKSLSSKEKGCYKRLDGISEFKRIIIKKEKIRNKPTLKVRGLTNFLFETDAEPWLTLRKKGWTAQSCSTVELLNIPLNHTISQAKKSDVSKLLISIFGENWKEDEDLRWYVDILNKPDLETSQQGLDPEEQCNCLDDDEGFHV